MGRAPSFAPSLLLLVCACLCACKAPAPGADAVAKVNGEVIVRKDFDELVERNLRRYATGSQALPQGLRSRIEEGVLRRMVDDLMVEQRCKQEGIVVSEVELTQHFTEHQKRFRNPQAFNDYLSRSDTSEAALKEDLRKSLLRDRLVDKLTGDIAISDDEVSHYYQENSAHFTEPQKMEVRRLLLRTPQDATAKHLSQVAKTARKLHDRAKAHADQFADLCKGHSEGPEAEHGGSMGLVTTGRMPELDKLMENGLVEGAISPITQTAQGLEIYQVTHVTAPHRRPLTAEARGIREALSMRRRNERRQEVLRSLKDGASVQLLITMTPPQAPEAVAPRAPTVAP